MSESTVTESRLESRIFLLTAMGAAWIALPWAGAWTRTRVDWQRPDGWTGEVMLGVAMLALIPLLLWLFHRYGRALMTEASESGESGCILTLALPAVAGFTTWALLGPWTALAADTGEVFAPVAWATFVNTVAFGLVAMLRGGA
ncbi:hypothetical protein [Streptomyces sp. H34-S4]|uniref:hypothetical protein n=1 Tax=Streptomyces sp. H34-S4 TaxID=2996463 RepID=UPI00226F640F|nr:hypothetical protein [Streptomyces sp. H34-S4]MCY0937343.1 hypothetical protein [Streptomyces sp. H34-S4]